MRSASEARKARLLALRNRKEGKIGDQNGRETIIKNRNFDPESRTIKKRTREDDVVMTDTVEKDVEGLAEKIITEDEQRQKQELDIFNIAPKRPNWDLKRELEKKTKVLERKTQEAIHTLIRQRLAAQKGDSDDLVGAMNADGARNESHSDEED